MNPKEDRGHGKVSPTHHAHGVASASECAAGQKPSALDARCCRSAVDSPQARAQVHLWENAYVFVRGSTVHGLGRLLTESPVLRFRLEAREDDAGYLIRTDDLRFTKPLLYH
jgi:hypothetical protein